MTTLYGIPNCDTVKKARLWLDENGVAYSFHDFKKQGVPPQLEAWAASLGWDKLLNRKGTTWRKLPSNQQDSVTDAASACQLMREQPSVIKRPVVEWGSQTTVGFDPSSWRELAR